MYAENKISDAAKTHLQAMRAFLETATDGMGIRDFKTLRKVQESILAEVRNKDSISKQFIKELASVERDFRRFFSLVEFSGCWIFNGNNNQYKRLKIFGGMPIRAHVLSFRLFNEDILPGMQVMHLCHNKSCVNPDHLRQGTAIYHRRFDMGIEPGKCSKGHDIESPGTTYWNGKTNICKCCHKIRTQRYQLKIRHLSIQGERIEL